MVKVICKLCEEDGKKNVVYTDGKDEPLIHGSCTRHRRTLSKDKVLNYLQKQGISSTKRISDHVDAGVGPVRRKLKELLKENSICKLYGYKKIALPQRMTCKRVTVYVLLENRDKYLGKETKEFGKIKSR